MVISRSILFATLPTTLSAHLNAPPAFQRYSVQQHEAIDWEMKNQNTRLWSSTNRGELILSHYKERERETDTQLLAVLLRVFYFHVCVSAVCCIIAACVYSCCAVSDGWSCFGLYDVGPWEINEMVPP